MVFWTDNLTGFVYNTMGHLLGVCNHYGTEMTMLTCWHMMHMSYLLERVDYGLIIWKKQFSVCFLNAGAFSYISRLIPDIVHCLSPAHEAQWWLWWEVSPVNTPSVIKSMHSALSIQRVWWITGKKIFFVQILQRIGSWQCVTQSYWASFRGKLFFFIASNMFTPQQGFTKSTVLKIRARSRCS